MTAGVEPEWITADGSDVHADIIRAARGEAGVVLHIGTLEGAQRERVAEQVKIELPAATAKNLHELLGRLIRDAEAAAVIPTDAPYRLRARGGL